MQNFANPVFILIAGLSLSGLSACGLITKSKRTTSSGVCSAGSIESSCAAQSSTVLSLTGRRPLAIKSGDTVTLTGTGFNKAMTATIGGIPVTSLDVTSATAASLVVPPGIKTGMSDLKLALTAAEATASVAYSPADGIPLMTVAASEVCSGVAFYDLNGDKQTGTKSCSTPQCTANASVGCVTTTSYKSADFTNLLASNIKSGVTVAGVAGEYSFVAPDAWDLRAGTVVGDVTGKLKVNCRNAVKLSGTGSIDNTTSPAGPGSDIWDTIHDYYGLPASTDFPSTWSVANYYCGNVEATAGDDNVWKDVTTTDGTTASTCTLTPDNCTMQDKISGLKWSKRVTSGVSWQDAITACNASLHNGQTAGSWRLPTQKELMDAYEHGMVSAASANWMTLVNIQDTFWSASSFDYDYAWIERLADGSTYTNPKIEGRNAVVCVR